MESQSLSRAEASLVEKPGDLCFCVEASEKEGLTILGVAVSASLYESSNIADYQFANDPSRPLDSLSPAALSKELVAIARKIRDAASSG
jgi:hypothetical protein